MINPILKVQKVRIVTMAILLGAACFLTYYFHAVLGTGTVFSHFFYIPIILASLWWKRKGLFVAIFLAAVLILSHIILRPDILTQNDYFRAPMFIIISLVTAMLSEQIAKSEESTKRAHIELHQIFSTATDGMCVIARDFSVLKVNKAFLILSGVSEDRALGKKCYEVFRGPLCRTPGCPLTRILSGEENVECEIEKEGKDGTRIYCIVTATPFLGAGDKMIGIVENFKDITERKRLQERLLASERLATLGQFSGSISHELRNPLGVIDSSVYYLKTKLKDADSKVLEHLERVKSSVSSSTAIIESLLNLTRMKEPQLGRLDLVAITTDAIATSKVLGAVNIVQDFPEQEVLVDADGEQLRMAFKNIIKNAVEAMDDKGTLTVTVHSTPDKQAELSFTDTGPGIAKENLEKVFQPLFSTRAKGIGFGLSIVRMIIDKHGGKIEAKSEPGKGATIIIRLPLPAGESKEV
jgi:PAS domain S-box-containing protein